MKMFLNVIWINAYRVDEKTSYAVSQLYRINCTRKRPEGNIKVNGVVSLGYSNRISFLKFSVCSLNFSGLPWSATVWGHSKHTQTHASHSRNLKDYISLQCVFLKGQHTHLYSPGYSEIHQISSTPPRPTPPHPTLPRVSIAPALNLSSLYSLWLAPQNPFKAKCFVFSSLADSLCLIYDTSPCMWCYGRCQLTGKSPWSLPGIWVNISLNPVAELFNFLM